MCSRGPFVPAVDPARLVAGHGTGTQHPAAFDRRPPGERVDGRRSVGETERFQKHRRLLRRRGLGAQCGCEPVSEPTSDVASIELELGSQMGDHVPHKDAGDEGVQLEPEVVVEDRLRQQSGAPAIVPPLKVLLVQIALSASVSVRFSPFRITPTTRGPPCP